MLHNIEEQFATLEKRAERNIELKEARDLEHRLYIQAQEEKARKRKEEMITTICTAWANNKESEARAEAERIAAKAAKEAEEAELKRTNTSTQAQIDYKNALRETLGVMEENGAFNKTGAIV